MAFMSSDRVHLPLSLPKYTKITEQTPRLNLDGRSCNIQRLQNKRRALIWTVAVTR